MLAAGTDGLDLNTNRVQEKQTKAWAGSSPTYDFDNMGQAETRIATV